jgi:hypothetical protein
LAIEGRGRDVAVVGVEVVDEEEQGFVGFPGSGEQALGLLSDGGAGDELGDLGVLPAFIGGEQGKFGIEEDGVIVVFVEAAAEAEFGAEIGVADDGGAEIAFVMELLRQGRKGGGEGGFGVAAIVFTGISTSK